MKELKLNPSNPRFIKKTQFEKLKKSVGSFTKMLEVRPIAYDEDGVIWGGNMRYRALQALGIEMKPEYFKELTGYTLEEKREFAIRDNIELGEWDDDVLANEWSDLPLEEWGVEGLGELGDFYNIKIKSPVYEITGECPQILELVDKDKVKELLKDIDAAEIDEEVKEFLKVAASRHYVFDYSKIAEFYAHSSRVIKELMERSALVIFDFNKAVGGGFVRMIKDLMDVQKGDYEG